MSDELKDGATAPEEELIVIDEEEEAQKAAEAAKADKDDERLAADDGEADDEDDSTDDEAQPGESREKARLRERNKRRRALQKDARERERTELEILRREVSELRQGFTQQQQATLGMGEQDIDQRLSQTLNDIRQAEAIHAQAIAASNGEDAVAALRIRDQAMYEANQLTAAKQQVQQLRQQQAAPKIDPQVQSYMSQWQQVNPWYDPSGADPDSVLARRIDAEVAREYDPRSLDYWEELTARLAENFEPAQKQTKRKGPPVGGNREHAPSGSRTEIRVTPERKAAMIELGVWDDPKSRNDYLKSYADWDRNNASR